MKHAKIYDFITHLPDINHSLVYPLVKNPESCSFRIEVDWGLNLLAERKIERSAGLYIEEIYFSGDEDEDRCFFDPRDYYDLPESFAVEEFNRESAKAYKRTMSDLGWVPVNLLWLDGIVFENIKPTSSVKDVMSKLSPWFSDEQLEAAYQKSKSNALNQS